MHPSSYFSLPQRCLGVIGETLSKEPLRLRQLIFRTTNFTIIFFFVVCMTYHALKNRDDVDRSTETLSPMLTGILNLHKYYIFCLQRTKLAHISKHVLELASNNQNIKFSKYYKINRNLSRLYVASASLAGLSIMAVCFIKNAYIYWKYNRMDRILPFPALDFMVQDSTPRFVLVYILCFIACTFIICDSGSVDTILLSSALSLSTQFSNLQKQAEGVGRNSRSGQSINLQQLIRRHKKLLQASDEIKDIFGPIIFSEFLISSLQLCVIVFQICMSATRGVVLFYLFFFVGVIAQLFIYCFAGSALDIESRNFATSLYLSRWYELPPREAKDIVFAMMVSQSKCYLKSVFFEAKLPYLITILSKTMSYLAILRSLQE